MDRFWLEKARQYILDHNAFDSVSEINFSDTPTSATISAIVSIGLPSKFIKAGITNNGVKDKEEIRFVFTDEFPLKAPKTLLRDDFPRSFPHINPSESYVNPCIYEGELSELLQQSEWMNGVLNQLVDWLEKAASDDLLDYDQGWEPMRNDNCRGFMVYDFDGIISRYTNKHKSFLGEEISYKELNNFILAGSLSNTEKSQKSHVIYFITPEIIKYYIPNSITELSQLYKYANSIGIHNIKDIVEEYDLNFINEDKLFMVLFVRRPAKLIGSDTDIEFLNFVIHKSKHRGSKRKESKRVLPECKVDMLSHILDNSPTLLQRLSGVKVKTNGEKNIALVGCGSLGSKIGVHLARNGNGPFLCIDHDIFMPHNNARHGLTLAWMENKAKILSFSLSRIEGISVNLFKESAFTVDYTHSKVIIDTTASLSVRNFLMSKTGLPPIISGGLYKQGQYGLLLLENKTKTNRLTDMWAHLYYQSISNESLQKILFSSNLKNVQIGQSCSSQTMITNDAQISLMAATMSLKIQNILENGLSKNGEILFTKSDNDGSLQTETISVPECIVVSSNKNRDWRVLLSTKAHEEMEFLLHSKTPNETGGVLLGSVFLYAKTVVITGILPAPPDSIEERHLFVLGTDELEGKIKDIETKTNGKVTYMGTWHSHPDGGNASKTDNNTYKKLLFVRNYEPTVCLIITHNEVLLV